MNREEEKQFEIQLPDDYGRNEFAGKLAIFKVTINEIKQESLPEVTDEFAAQVEPETQTVEVLRERIETDLRTRAEERSKQDFEERVIEAVVDVSEVEYPPIMVDVEIHELLDEQARRLQMQGLTMEQYLKAMNKTDFNKCVRRSDKQKPVSRIVYEFRKIAKNRL